MAISFRPLTGNYISQFSATSPWIELLVVSVPLRGTTFLNEYINHEKIK